MIISQILAFLIALPVGIISGFCSSAPLGPINLWIADMSLSGLHKRLTWFVIGVIIVDMSFALMAIWGHNSLVIDESFALYLSIFGGFFLILLGIFNIRSLRQPKITATHPQKRAFTIKHLGKDFVLGAFLCGSNPAFLMFWIFVVNFLIVRNIIHFDALQVVGFTLGIGVGDLLWFVLLVKLVEKGRTLTQPQIVTYFRLAIALLFIGSGFFAIGRGLL